MKETEEADTLTVRNELDAAPVEDFNQTLATERATAVVRYLTEWDVDEGNFGVVAVGVEGGTNNMPRLYPSVVGKR